MRIVALGLAILTLFLVSCLGLLGCGAVPTAPVESRPGHSPHISGASLQRHPIAGEYTEPAHGFTMQISPSGRWILRNARPDWTFAGRGARTAGRYHAENSTHTLDFEVTSDLILCKLNTKSLDGYGLRFGLHRSR